MPSARRRRRTRQNLGHYHGLTSTLARARCGTPSSQRPQCRRPATRRADPGLATACVTTPPDGRLGDCAYSGAVTRERVPLLTEAGEYNGQSAIAVACTQLGPEYTAGRDKRVLDEWVDLLGTRTELTELEFRTRTPKRLFAALAGHVAQSQVGRLRRPESDRRDERPSSPRTARSIGSDRREPVGDPAPVAAACTGRLPDSGGSLTAKRSCRLAGAGDRRSMDDAS